MLPLSARGWSFVFLSARVFRMTTGARPPRPSPARRSTVCLRKISFASPRIWRTAWGWTAAGTLPWRWLWSWASWCSSPPWPSWCSPTSSGQRSCRAVAWPAKASSSLLPSSCSSCCWLSGRCSSGPRGPAFRGCSYSGPCLQFWCCCLWCPTGSSMESESLTLRWAPIELIEGSKISYLLWM